MKKVLYMHMGSENHGCEALIRTTSEMINDPSNTFLWSFSKGEDLKYDAVNKFNKVLASEELSRNSIEYYKALYNKKILHKNNQLELFIKKLFKNSIAISIGGDNYCYEFSAKKNAELNQSIRKYAKKTALWACSIDEKSITDEIEEDIRKYDLITAREEYTFELLKNINSNVKRVADPAFLLSPQKSPFLQNLPKEDMVGINISPLIMGYGKDSTIIDNYKRLIEYIISETKMSICFIPHVVWEINNDLETIDMLYKLYKSTGRVYVADDSNVAQLKDLISNMKFFVGARTHATIAAYSTFVPTLVVGYSIKSRGIARDLFGTDENYVVSVQDMSNADMLVEEFKWLIKNEKQIKEKLHSVIPDYKKKAILGLEYLNQLED